jgi:hypothetical protein
MPHHKLRRDARTHRMSNDDRTLSSKRAQDLVDSRGLIAAGVAAGPFRKAKWRDIECNDAKTGCRQGIDGAAPKLTPRDAAVNQHDGNAVSRPLLLHEHTAGARCHQMAGRRCQLAANAGFVHRGGHPKCRDNSNNQKQQDKQGPHHPAQDFGDHEASQTDLVSLSNRSSNRRNLDSSLQSTERALPAVKIPGMIGAGLAPVLNDGFPVAARFMVVSRFGGDRFCRDRRISEANTL